MLFYRLISSMLQFLIIPFTFDKRNIIYFLSIALPKYIVYTRSKQRDIFMSLYTANILKNSNRDLLLCSKADKKIVLHKHLIFVTLIVFFVADCKLLTNSLFTNLFIKSKKTSILLLYHFFSVH